jgi:hypothetical protein
MDERDLRPPNAMYQDATEVLRVWARPEGDMQFGFRTTWPDPAIWGHLFADVARKVAAAYAGQGEKEPLAFARILQGFEAALARGAEPLQ